MRHTKKINAFLEGEARMKLRKITVECTLSGNSFRLEIGLHESFDEITNAEFRRYQERLFREGYESNYVLTYSNLGRKLMCQDCGRDYTWLDALAEIGKSQTDVRCDWCAGKLAFEDSKANARFSSHKIVRLEKQEVETIIAQCRSFDEFSNALLRRTFFPDIIYTRTGEARNR
jgi:hypothetical protein